MLKIISIPKTVHCANCGQNLNGRAVNVASNENHSHSIILCARCIEKAARVLRDKERTNQIIYVISRYASNRFLAVNDSQIYYDHKDAENAYIEMFEEDITRFPEKEREPLRKMFQNNLAQEAYIYNLEDKNTKHIVHVEMRPEIVR